MNNLVAEANDLALLDDHMPVGCLRGTGLLMDWEHLRDAPYANSLIMLY